MDKTKFIKPLILPGTKIQLRYEINLVNWTLLNSPADHCDPERTEANYMQCITELSGRLAAEFNIRPVDRRK